MEKPSQRDPSPPLPTWHDACRLRPADHLVQRDSPPISNEIKHQILEPTYPARYDFCQGGWGQVEIHRDLPYSWCRQFPVELYSSRSRQSLSTDWSNVLVKTRWAFSVDAVSALMLYMTSYIPAAVSVVSLILELEQNLLGQCRHWIMLAIQFSENSG